MSKIGRNDPCPCGSGKKYKYCCLVKHEDPELLFQRTLERAERRLRDKLIKFSSSHRFDEDVRKAFKLFFNDKYELGDDIEGLLPEDMDRFVDWFIFDWDLSDYNKPVIDVFRESRSYMLDGDELQLMENWSDTVLSAYVVESVLEGEGLDVVDLLNEDVSLVLSVAPDESRLEGIKVGDVVVTRIIPVGEKWFPSGALTYLAAGVKDDVRAALDGIVSEVRAESPNASVQECLKRRGYMLNHLIMEIEERKETGEVTEEAEAAAGGGEGRTEAGGGREQESEPAGTSDRTSSEDSTG